MRFIIQRDRLARHWILCDFQCTCFRAIVLKITTHQFRHIRIDKRTTREIYRLIKIDRCCDYRYQRFHVRNHFHLFLYLRFHAVSHNKKGFPFGYGIVTSLVGIDVRNRILAIVVFGPYGNRLTKDHCIVRLIIATFEFEVVTGQIDLRRRRNCRITIHFIRVILANRNHKPAGIHGHFLNLVGGAIPVIQNHLVIERFFDTSVRKLEIIKATHHTIGSRLRRRCSRAHLYAVKLPGHGVCNIFRQLLKTGGQINVCFRTTCNRIKVNLRGGTGDIGLYSNIHVEIGALTKVTHFCVNGIFHAVGFRCGGVGERTEDSFLVIEVRCSHVAGVRVHRGYRP